MRLLSIIAVLLEASIFCARSASLVLGAASTNTITVPFEQHRHMFEANAGDAVTIYMAEASESSPVIPEIVLLGPSNDSLGTFWGYDWARLHVTALPSSGTYTVICRDAAGTGNTGPYAVSVVRNPGPNEQEAGDDFLEFGKTLYGFLGNGDQDVFTFQGVQGSDIRLLLAEESGELVPHVEVQAPNGTVLGSGSGYSSVQLHIQNLPSSGTYHVLAWPDGRSYGRYALTVVESPGSNQGDEDAAVLSQCATITNDLGWLADIDTARFHAKAGDSVRILMEKTGGSGYYPRLHLHAPDRSQLASATGGTSASITVNALPQTGTYLVLCSADDGHYLFRYALDMTIVPAAGSSGVLGSRLCGNQLLLSWAMDQRTWQLQSTRSLHSMQWTNVNVSPSLLGTTYYVKLPVGLDREFFRLHCSNCP